MKRNMLCRNCGQEIPEKYTACAPQKPKGNGIRRGVTQIAAVAAAFVTVYTVTGAGNFTQAKAFDVPDSFTFDTQEKENECKTFVMEGDTGRTYTKFFYGEDGIVDTVSGAITVYDAAAVDVSYLDGLREDAEIASDLLEEMGVSDASFVIVTENTESYDYSETFEFASLEEHTDVAELAAAFIGFEADNGRITIDKAGEAMLGFGYTLLETTYDVPDFSMDLEKEESSAETENSIGAESSTEAYPGESTDWHEGSAGVSWITFDFLNSRVNLIRGHIYSTDIPDGSSFVNAAQAAEMRLEELKAGGYMYRENSSLIIIAEDAASGGYGVDFVFSCLDKDPYVAELATSLLGIEMEAGEIDYLTASRTVRAGFGLDDGGVWGWEGRDFEIKYSDSGYDYCRVGLQSEEDSAFVSRVTVDVNLNSSVDGYEDLVTSYVMMTEKIRQSDWSELVSISIGEEEYQEDYFWVWLDFQCLDEGNPDAAAFVAECLGLPVQSGFLLAEECGQSLLDQGFALTGQNGWSTRE